MISFAKLRLNHAVVGNDTGPYNVFRAYTINPAINGAASASNPSTLPNSNLKAETTTENEIGLEINMLDRKLSFDFSFCLPLDAMIISCDHSAGCLQHRQEVYSSMVLGASSQLRFCS